MNNHIKRPFVPAPKWLSYAEQAEYHEALSRAGFGPGGDNRGNSHGHSAMACWSLCTRADGTVDREKGRQANPADVAPELLEALVAILETADLSFGEGEQAAKVGNAVISQARAAIEKANGKDHPPATPDRGEFDGYKVSLSCDPAYYGSECTDADAERIFGKLSELIRSQFPGIQVARWDDTRRSSATTGPDEAVCDEIHQWISDNWTKAL